MLLKDKGNVSGKQVTTIIDNFQQSGILTSVDSDDPGQPPFSLLLDLNV